MNLTEQKQQTISEFYAQDHDRLDQLFLDFQKSKRESYPHAKEYFVAFKFGLQRHIIWEEQVLFPFFEQATGMKDHGPTVVMRHEHRIIGECLENLHKKVQKADPNSDAEEEALLAALKTHNFKEESILYPMIDRFAAKSGALAELYQEMSSIPEEAYKKCCNHS